MLNVQCSKHIIFGQEIGSLPIHYLYFGFLCRMDVELVEYHHPLVVQVVEGPLLCLTIGREVRAERRVAGLGETHILRTVLQKVASNSLPVSALISG